jgi:photosystem II stability/assembly factor-like uncharacterized protein
MFMLPIVARKARIIAILSVGSSTSLQFSMMRILHLFVLLWLSTSAYAQWQIQDAHTTSDLRAVDYVGDGVAWASGADGTVLRTEDAGLVWQTCTIPPGAEQFDFRGIQAFDKKTSIVMSSGKGHLSRLYKTIDGCHSWTLVFTNPDREGSWAALSFADSVSKHHADDGILIGHPVGGVFSIFQSSDQGSSWAPWITRGSSSADPKRKKAKAKDGEVLFAASNGDLSFWFPEYFIFVTGGTSGARLYYVDVPGFCEELGTRCTLKFAHVDLPGFQRGPSSGAFAIAATNHHSYFPLRLMVVGGDYERPQQGNAVFVSSRDGFHIPLTSYFNVNASKVPPQGYRSAVAYDEQHNAWVTVGPNGTDISNDDGNSWQPLKPSQSDPPDADLHWNAISLPFVVGSHGRIGLLKAGPLPH